MTGRRQNASGTKRIIKTFRKWLRIHGQQISRNLTDSKIFKYHQISRTLLGTLLGTLLNVASVYQAAAKRAPGLVAIGVLHGLKTWVWTIGLHLSIGLSSQWHAVAQPQSNSKQFNKNSTRIQQESRLVQISDYSIIQFNSSYPVVLVPSFAVGRWWFILGTGGVATSGGDPVVGGVSGALIIPKRQGKIRKVPWWLQA